MSKSNATLILTIVSIFGCLTFGSARVAYQARQADSPDQAFVTNENSLDPTAPANSIYYSVRQDMRRCVSPICGGYFVKRVNERVTRCANGKPAEECYVAEIDWNKHQSVEPSRALLRGDLTEKRFPNFGKLGVFRVLEAWQSAGGATSNGRFYRVIDRKIQCIAFPCPTHRDVLLNSNVSTNIAGVDLKAIKVDDTTMTEARTALGQPQGLIVTGTHVRVKGPGGQANSLSGTQFYLPTKEEASAKPCMKTGCSNQICAEEAVVTTCEYRMEYECYKKATCERQQDGNCGFTKTAELQSCITRMQKKSGD